MAKKLFVGNLAWETTTEDLKALFEQYGTVEDAFIVMDKESHRSKGFGFVTFTDDAEADAAIEALEGHDMNGRNIAVNEARPPKPRY
jgi:cold-inducible RNA-binding protein